MAFPPRQRSFDLDVEDMFKPVISMATGPTPEKGTVTR